MYWLQNRLIGWGLAALAVAIFIGAVYGQGRTDGARKVQQAWDREKATIAEQQAKAITEVRERERVLQAQVDQERRKHREEVSRITSEYERMVGSLRERPENRVDNCPVYTDTGAPAGCTGAGLARPDAEFLAGYAADAARLEATLEQCRAAYEAVRISR